MSQVTLAHAVHRAVIGAAVSPHTTASPPHSTSAAARHASGIATVATTTRHAGRPAQCTAAAVHSAAA
jgi:hypothetical protein